VIEGAHHDGEEYAWHPDGADVPVAPLLAAIGGLLMLLGMVGWVIADAARAIA
jgi:hypothetical protein